MHNHKYFPSKDLYNEWIRQNAQNIIVDLTEVDKGLWIEYIQYNIIKQKAKRGRKW